jgi:hypothetical protein
MKYLLLLLSMTLLVFHSCKQCAVDTDTRVVHDYTVDAPCLEAIQSTDFYANLGEALYARHFLDEAYSDRSIIMPALKDFQIQMLKYDSIDAGYCDLYTIQFLGLCRE